MVYGWGTYFDVIEHNLVVDFLDVFLDDFRLILVFETEGQILDSSRFLLLHCLVRLFILLFWGHFYLVIIYNQLNSY